MNKLYTKEMFLIAAEKCEVSMIDAKHIMQYIDEYVTPIQLPTADEILYESQGVFVNRIDMYEEGFIDGAEWVVNKIKGGQEWKLL